MTNTEPILAAVDKLAREACSASERTDVDVASLAALVRGYIKGVDTQVEGLQLQVQELQQLSATLQEAAVDADAVAIDRAFELRDSIMQPAAVVTEQTVSGGAVVRWAGTSAPLPPETPLYGSPLATIGVKHALKEMLDIWHGGHIQVRSEASGHWTSLVEVAETLLARPEKNDSNPSEVAAGARYKVDPVVLEDEPVDIVVFCPKCGLQHIDADEWVDDPHDIEQGRILKWKNDPHRSHLCRGCGYVWRPADVPTNGVAAVKTRGKTDSPIVKRAHTAEGQVFGIIDPDYGRVYTIIRKLAWEEGYAIGLHGSFTRDLDLIAVPWVEKPAEAEHLIARICDATGLQNLQSNPGLKPQGRRAWTLLFPDFSDPRFVDLSIMPMVART